MLVYYGDELLALAIDGRDVAGVFGRVERPSTLLEMEVWALLLGRRLDRGHRKAESRRCFASAVNFRGGFGRSSRSSVVAAACRVFCKGEVGVEDGDFSSLTPQQ
jgi:hypothetical protein